MRSDSPDDPPPPRRGARKGSASKSGGPLDWDDFRRRRSAWLDRFSADAPVYRLPKAVVDELERARFIDEEAARAEAELMEMCRRRRAVGFQDGSPIDYPFLLPGAVEPARGRSIRARDDQARRNPSKKRLGDADLRRKGYVGRLLTDPAFLEEFANQKAHWTALPAADRPPLPIRGAIPASASPAAAAFAAAFAEFLGRWALDGVAAWDLPMPSAAVVADRPPAASPAPRGVHVFLPFHLPPDDDLLRRIRGLQREQVRGLGLDDAVAKAARYEAFARMLEILHIERVASARYRPEARASGFVGVLVPAIASSVGLGEDQVRKWRKTASARLKRGASASTPAFRGPS